ncbi:MAG: PSD1 and planctomycete cytochrome C domain-containing protein [Verrucomicrobiales bacterium]|nr:PSD1 and planctomycete cytochrome C domain-containing protein [Verrucomicrobiales bacterium]
MNWFRMVALMFLVFQAAQGNEITKGEKLFALEVKPLFAEKCLACHGDEPEKLKGDFDMRTREAILKGGEAFGVEVVIPGKGAESFLYLTTTRKEADFEMPPKEADQLSEQQQWAIRDWINEGAPWPSDQRIAEIQEKYAEGEQVATSKALSEEWQNRRYESEKLWAYRPLKVSQVPPGQNPVDWFINRKLGKAGLDPAPRAEGTAILRRVHYGLTGLPPSPEVVRVFEKKYSDDPAAAVVSLADDLMDSPHYGEHFGQHWLDVTRYADTAGFANDYSRPNAWRYRDYVIRAFNDDKPYDQFVKEQIAGDEIDPENPENLIATGFLRMGPWEQTGMSVFIETRQLWLDDVTDSVGQTFLAHAMQCAKCHDHKFDPVPTRDYYGMMAVFSTTQFAERPAPFLPTESIDGFAASDEWVKAKIKGYSEQNAAIQRKIQKLKKQESGDAKTGDNGLDPGDENNQARLNKNIKRHQLELDKTQAFALSVYTGKTIRRNNIYGRMPVAANPWGKGYFDEDAILTGGDIYSPGDQVEPAALSAAEVLSGMQPGDFPSGQGARRVALADWIVDQENPLTARVIVNRVWSWLFGKGIAGNPNNFGGTGLLPTHPELLDYLAAWFLENGASVKKLNALIIQSDAYQRSTRHPAPAQLERLDPKGELYAFFQPRRLTAEEFRDAMLTVSGELNPSVGGIPVRPDFNPEVAFQPRQIMGGTASVYEPDPLPRQRNRRSIYTEKIRGLRDPFFETFNQPGPDNSCELRETSTVAPQALTLMNSREVEDRAVAFSNHLLTSRGSEGEVIDRAFLTALSRLPTPAERKMCLAEWAEATREESAIEHEKSKLPAVITRTVRAEKTGEFYDFEEKLPAYENYVADLQKADLDARTRGLAHICLVLFNLNEFAYLD